MRQRCCSAAAAAGKDVEEREWAEEEEDEVDCQGRYCEETVVVQHPIGDVPAACVGPVLSMFEHKPAAEFQTAKSSSQQGLKMPVAVVERVERVETEQRGEWLKAKKEGEGEGLERAEEGTRISSSNFEKRGWGLSKGMDGEKRPSTREGVPERSISRR